MLLNFAAFYAGWFASVLGAASGYPWMGPLFSVLWLGTVLILMRHNRNSEMMLLVSAGLLGYCMDSMLVLTGWVRFPETAQLGWPSSLWMVALWVNLAATLRGSMGWMRRRYRLGFLFGLISGPLAYWSGAKLGAMILVRPELAFPAIAVEWGVSLPALLALESLTARKAAKDSPFTVEVQEKTK